MGDEAVGDLLQQQHIQDRVILDLPIESPFGDLKPLSILTYMQRLNSLSIVSMNKKYLLAEYGKGYQEQTGDSDKAIFTMLKNMNAKHSLFHLLKEYFTDIMYHYIIITRFVKFHEYNYDPNNPASSKDLSINEDDTPLTEKEYTEAILQKSLEFIFSLDDDQFDLFRSYLIQLHGQSEPRAFLNPKLQRNEEKGKNSKLKRKSSSPTLTTMISSCATYMGINYSEITKWNALQLQHSFQRIALFIHNNATTLFSTVASDVEQVEWSANIDDNPDKEDITLDDFKQNVSGS
ncbi:hypothetical protein [Staphylococcus gallinarum]|uniref:hypothetical protein n=1 Tax=Staphylococcus gallinarum TaxID=1293 RepID=UPI0030BBB60A